MDEADCKELLRPVKRELKQLKAGTDDLGRDQKVTVLKDCLSAIGGRIDAVLESDFASKSTREKEKWRKHLWVFASFFWPKKVSDNGLVSIWAFCSDAMGCILCEQVKHSKLKAIFEKLVGTTPAAPASAPKAVTKEDGKRKASSGTPLMDGPIPKKARPSSDTRFSTASPGPPGPAPPTGNSYSGHYSPHVSQHSSQPPTSSHHPQHYPPHPSPSHSHSHSHPHSHAHPHAHSSHSQYQYPPYHRSSESHSPYSHHQGNGYRRR